ncbi:zinc finger ccch domain-containing protein [Anaeramoeba ignava]|uniref:Zinc finger ccch domain-containing protein n=1 Tax=Anaeramoeba ignava TaxID=1746090 RepID=A0A9Q0R8F4_ANAIG|nr:zinc finger ccch domain-containing protein [Anaeramoeba ignava]
MECYNISSDPRIIVLQFTEENKINFYCESIQLAIILPKMINYFIKGEENRIIPKQEEEKITNEIPIFTETMKTDNSFQYEFYLEANSYEHVTMFKVDDDELEVEDGIEKRKTQPLTSHKSEVFLQTYSMSNIVQMPSQTNQGDLITAPTILKSQGSILKSSTSLLKSNRSFLQSSRGLLKQTSTLLKSNKNLMKKSSNVLRSQDLMPSKSFAKTKSILSRSQTSLKPQLSSVISRELSHISNQSPQDLIYDVLPNEPVYLVDDIPYLHPVSRFNIEIMDEISLQFVPNQDIVFSKYAISIFSKNYRSSIHALGSRMQLFRAKDPLIIRIHFDDGKIYILRFTSEKQVKDFLSILKNCQSHLTDKIIVQNLRKYYPCSVVYKSQQYYGTIIVCDLVLVVLLPFLLRIIPLNKNLTCYRHESNELIRKIVFKNEEYICTYYSQTEQESFKSSFSEALIKYPKKAKEMKESAEQRRVSEVYHHSEKKQRIRTQVTLFEYLFTLGEEPSKYSERINKESTLQIDPMNNLKTKLNFINVSYVISFIDFDEAEKFRYQFSQFIKTGDEMDNLELLEAQKMEKERDNREKEERENEERERLEKERLERERKERERRERERLEKERLERERLEKERLQRERKEEERRRKEEEEERERKRKEKEEKKRRKLEKAQRKKEKQEKLEREKRERERRAQELLLAQKEEEERQRLQREKEERERAKMPVLEDNQVVDLQIPDENVEDAILFDVDILDRTSKPIQKGQLKLSPKELVLEIGEESFTFDYDKHKLNTNPRNLMTIRMDFSDSHKIVRFADIDQTKLFFAKFYQFKSLN